MTADAAPFFVRPHRFDDADLDDGRFPSLDGYHRILLGDGEQVFWQGQLQVAGYLVGPAPDQRELRWALPRPADVIVTDRRVAYVCGGWNLDDARPLPDGAHRQARHRYRPAPPRTRLAIGQVRWQWPSRLQMRGAAPGAGRPAGPALPAPRTAEVASPNSRPLPAISPNLRSLDPPGVSPAQNGGPAAAVRPAGGRRVDRASADEQLLIVCDALRETRQPALALAAVSPRTVWDLAVVVRRAIARFRLANPHTVELSPPERDALRRRAGTVSFTADLADPARGVRMPGALVVEFLDRDDYYRWSPRRAGNHRRVGIGGGRARDFGRPGSAS